MWQLLDQEGLTSGESRIERLEVHIRFLVLASLYRDWCSLVFDEIDDDWPALWLGPACVHPFHIGQMVGRDVDLDDPEHDLGEALNLLMDRERESVVAAILKGLGGDEGLFISLWRSMNGTERQAVLDEDDEEPSEETDSDILNDVTNETLAGYEWIREGCPQLGPERVRGKIDTGW